jgi:hypothetical protein
MFCINLIQILESSYFLGDLVPNCIIYKSTESHTALIQLHVRYMLRFVQWLNFGN